MIETGVIHGRFQIFHLKHMEYVLAAKMRCKKLFIGITHADIVSYAATSSLDSHGITKKDNPLSYFERMEMIQGALADFGIKREEYEIVPFPISQPDLILQYAPKDATYFMSLCGAWDEERHRILQGLDVETEVLWQKNEDEHGITGTAIRQLIAEGEEWQHFVPKTVAEYLSTHEVEQRIKTLYHV